MDGLKFVPQLWSNAGEKQNKTRSIHVHKLDIIALNDFFWVDWHSLGEKIFKTVKFCENRLSIRNSYSNRVGVSWGSPTPTDYL